MTAPDITVIDDLCEFCGRHPRWTDIRFGHRDGWNVCVHCLKANLLMNERRGEARLRMEPPA